MVSLYKSATFNKLLLSSVLVTFSLAVVNPSPAYAQINIGMNDITFALKMKDLVDKAWKYKDRQDVTKLLDTVFEIKVETEAYSGVKINIDQELDKAEKELKKQAGNKIPNKDIQAVRKYIKKKEKKAHQRAMCMAAYIQDSPPGMTFEDFEFSYLAAHGHDKEDKDDKEMKELPVKLAVGISMMLAGGFLCGVGVLLKIQPCITYGEALVIGGVNFAIDGYASKSEEDKNKEKDKR
ncbi:conserved putative secreted protein (plasmid) [Candidatus Protochlamydia naegleriophila]|uniref:Conserved putative secreted protein n=1 Tax=Candidatus Protochlamydia naegleriophila TaxID=389348 RepID=A0A0U5JE29_9BACT|nr:hypothetical protein [Candidatus Protochlamydia naegleriophila]CUI18136.1 conserved putative secreted protein [Candidatus Protochlamydia naegleriophila]